MFGRAHIPEALPTSEPAAPSSTSDAGHAQTPQDRLAGDFAEAGETAPVAENPLTKTKEIIYARLMEQIDLQTAARMPLDEKEGQP